jgi:hypothetical protein
MAHAYREVTRTTVRENDNDYIEEPISVAPEGTHIAARLVSLAGGTIMAVLGIRFVLALLGANPANPFADFIYTVSRPFVSPFFGLFNYQGQLGVGRFEFETLIAILFWGFVTWIIIQLITIGSRD